MGEIMYPMVKCQPDISAHAILLSQFMHNPGAMYYKATKHLLWYLAATKSLGIHYWQKTLHPDLQEQPLPTLHSDKRLPNWIHGLRLGHTNSKIKFYDRHDINVCWRSCWL
jgi:hypothetical protein